MEPIYVVLVITIVIWIGIFGYMMNLDGQVKKMRKIVDEFQKNGNK